MNAKCLMVMGTASDVGKSVVVTGLCRAFARAGVRVAPFKAQNMSNNAAVCPGGGEIGRAQAVQAEAAGLAPALEMNPVLLKPEADSGCQVVIGGTPRFKMNSAEYGRDRYRSQAWPEIVRSFRALAGSYELIIIEGAGGAAEINLRDRDVVNWPIADLAEAPVLLIADIDKGGVFASLLGTYVWLTNAEQKRVKGFVINKFRGDPGLLDDGLRLLEQRTGVPVIGVLPYLDRLHVPQEDSAMLEARARRQASGALQIGAIRLPRISNFTDLEPFESEPDVALHYVTDPATAPRLDLLIIPGSKNTVADLRWLREAGWESYLVNHVQHGGLVLGICGGYQMLGQRILDPRHIESDSGAVVGLGLLDVITRFEGEKITSRVEGSELATAAPIAGYEIHHGRITPGSRVRAFINLTRRDGRDIDELEGMVDDDGRVLGTSIHGLFDCGEFRRGFIEAVLAARGKTRAAIDTINGAEIRMAAYDAVADTIEKNLHLERIAAIAGVRLPPRH